MLSKVCHKRMKMVHFASVISRHGHFLHHILLLLPTKAEGQFPIKNTKWSFQIRRNIQISKLWWYKYKLKHFLFEYFWYKFGNMTFDRGSRELLSSMAINGWNEIWSHLYWVGRSTNSFPDIAVHSILLDSLFYLLKAEYSPTKFSSENCITKLNADVAIYRSD